MDIDATVKQGGRTVAAAIQEEGIDGESVRKEDNVPEVSVKEEGYTPGIESKTVFALVAKFLSVDVMNREMNRKMKSDIKEYLCYSEIIRELNELQTAHAPDEPKISIPKLLFGKCTDKDFILVMENIKVKGYETYDKCKGLDFEHLQAGIDQLARLHALSYAYTQSNDLRKKHTCFPSTTDYVKRFKLILLIMTSYCIKFLKSRDDLQDIAKRFEESLEGLVDQISPSLAYEHEIDCLNHGDFWNSNLLYKYKESGLDGTKRVIEAVMMIDWGNVSIGTPLFDLQYLLHTSTTGEVRRTHLEEILQQYHNSFTTLATKMGVPATNWTYEQFKKEWDRTYVVGFFLGIALTLGTLSTQNPINKPSEPSVLDKSYMMPVKMAVDGIKSGMAKLMVPVMLQHSGKGVIKVVFNQMLKPVFGELLSGKNEVMTRRLLDLVHEADEKGLFKK